MSRNYRLLLLALLGGLIVVIFVVFATSALSARAALEWLWLFANSNFSIAMITAFAGAFAGAIGAQFIAERNAKRERLFEEMRATKYAIGLLFNISNTFLVIKEQHINTICVKYNKLRLLRDQYEAAMRAGDAPPGPFRYEADLETLPVPFTPIDSLQKILLDKVTPTGKAMILLTPLVQCIEEFRGLIDERNKWIGQYREIPFDQSRQKADAYFGKVAPNGDCDRRYPSLMQGLSLMADNCIGFSVVLGGSLIEHGKALAAQYGNGAPSFSPPNWSKAVEASLMPDMKPFTEWGS
jgi:hypothetical protein